jgi:hypothetical protein
MTEMKSKTKVEVFVNRRKLELHEEDTTGAELLQAADFEGAEWDLFKLQGEGDPTGGELIQSTDPIRLKNGDRFRVIPGNRTFGEQ